MKHFLPVILFSQMLMLAGMARAADENLVRAQLLADTSAIVPGKPFTLGVRLVIMPNWHIYWVNPGDAGLPTTVKLDLPDGFKADAVEFPTPHRFMASGDILSYGYENEVMLLIKVTPPAQISGASELSISAKADWLVCQDNCIKQDARLKISLPISADGKPANAELFDRWQKQLPQQPEQGPAVHLTSQIYAPGGQFKSAAVKVTIDWKQRPTSVDWFPAPTDQLNIKSIDLKNEANQSVLTFNVEALANKKVTNPVFSSVLAYTVDGRRVGVILPVALDSAGATKVGG